jgi:eukaryotic-like serine/threonine-protein kinase
VCKKNSLLHPPSGPQDVGVNELASGILLGHYKVVRRLGQGGMGVVYEAVDQKLGRNVAVKLLTEATRDSSSAVERFWREARAASSLNHPGICTIYELNETAESPFIVMELLEGNSLEKLYRGHAMPYPKLLEMGVQLTDALDAAHRKGILHRDIKPANIFMTKSGQAKLLDFGLAKLEGAAASDESGEIDAVAQTTLNPLTSSGSSVGTIAYMSPEQARSEPLDSRSDLFSLGVVLYEMATGRHPFSGVSTAVVFDHILNHAPVAPISLNPQLPVEFENILNKTLEKDPDLRCQFAGELRADLKRLQRKSSSGSGVSSSAAFGSSPSQLPDSGASHPSQTGQPGVGVSSSTAPGSAPGISGSAISPPAARKPRGLAIGIAALLVLAAIGFAAWRFWPRPQPFASVFVSQITNVGTIEKVALSADGKFLAEVKNDNGQRTLWLKNTATNTDTQILSANGGSYVGLTLSADGNYLYFTRGTPESDGLHALYVMSVFGGTPRQLIMDIDSAPSFAPDGRRFTYVRYTPGRSDQLTEVHIADKDGNSDQIFYSSKEELGWPVWSPDGGRIAWLQGVSGARKVVLGWIDLSSKKLNTVAAPADVTPSFQESVMNLAWLPDNRHLLVLYLKPHTDRAQIGIVTIPSGEFYPLTNDVSSYSELALSADGRTLATVLTNVDSSIAYYKPAGGAPVSTTPLRITPTTIAWADEGHLLFIVEGISIGSLDRATGNLRTFDVGDIDVGRYITPCPDGHILFTGFPKGEGEARIFRMNADGGELAQITTTGIARRPVCSADSRQVHYSVRSGSESSVWSIPIAGGTPKELLPTVTNSTGSVAISPDEKLGAIDLTSQLKHHLEAVDLASRRVVFQGNLDTSDFTRGSPVLFSPDSRALVYSVRRDGGITLLSQPIDGSAAHTLIDPGAPINDFDWSPSGKQLAVARVKSTSDVVLITDQAGKNAH